MDTKKRVFKQGEIIFKQGQTGVDMYIVQKGKVSIDAITPQGKKMNFGVIGPRDFFGEMSVFDNKRRTATARALVETETIVINKHAMTAQLDQLPSWFLTMFKTLIARLRDADSRLVFMDQVKTKKDLNVGGSE